ncbi:MAG: hypothetical protein U0441_29215, partial [Polyangiaceae bacterium]
VAGSLFMDAIQRLDVVLYGARDLTAPRWALYDCAGLPGAVIGFARGASSLSEEERALLAVPADHAGIVPISMMIATPMLGGRRWLVYTIGAAPLGVEALEEQTLALGLAMLNAVEITATVQWDSKELSTFASLAPLRVRAAWLPVHEINATCVIRIEATSRADMAARAEVAARAEATSRTQSERRPTEELLDPRDAHALRDLQRDIEGGAAITITGPPTRTRDGARVPIRREVPS